MSKEKQIEEIAKDLCRLTELHCDCGNGRPCFRVLKKAEALYNAGYRKQREGEWKIYSCSYECSICKEEFVPDGYAADYDPITDLDLHYCPNCGAKMKGE